MKMLILFFLFMFTEQPRQVLLFYTSNGKTAHDKQLAELKKHKSGVMERDIEIKSYLYSPETDSEWRKNKIDTDSSFTFILIGRDGGEKYRAVVPVSAATLFGQIDAMPMRRTEMKKE
jgi:hypothetical protein